MEQDNHNLQRTLLRARLQEAEQKVRELASLVPLFSDPVKRAECRAALDTAKEEADATRRELDQLS